MIKIFTDNAWEEYNYWQEQDKKTLKKINKIIKDIDRTPFDGMGKPEPLKYKYSGYWSRRIDDVNRIVYKIENNSLIIYQCKGHYEE